MNKPRRIRPARPTSTPPKLALGLFASACLILAAVSAWRLYGYPLWLGYRARIYDLPAAQRRDSAPRGPFILEIPRIDLRWVVGVVAEPDATPCGIPQKALDQYGIVLAPACARPGADGVAVLAAHRYRTKPLADLDKLRPGDRIHLAFADGTEFLYTVDYLRIVLPDDLGVLGADCPNRPELRIITCLLGSNARRLVIFAHMQ